jgi:flagellum-specific ATP synthase
VNALANSIRRADWVRKSGRIVRIVGQTVEAEGPAAKLGEICDILSPTGQLIAAAEVIGFSERRVLLMPYGDLRGCQPGVEVRATGKEAAAQVGTGLLGHVVDAFGNLLDSDVPATFEEQVALYPPPLNPLSRGEIHEPIGTGVRVIDTLLPLGRGQRIGIFAGSGVGKSTLLTMLSRNLDADVLVIALVGERGREVRAMVDRIRPTTAWKKTVVVAATSDQPPLTRARAAFYATAIAEHFRARGMHVALLMDSITRVATAQREMGLAAGELPTARGYTPSVFAMLPRLLERGGVRAAGGTLTGLYTVLVDGDDFNDPLVDAVRAILDGHIVLSRAIAQRGRYPAVDVLRSVSRLVPALCTKEDRRLLGECIKLLAAYESARDLIEVGAYRQGVQPETDKAVTMYPRIEEFLQQSEDASFERKESWNQLRSLVSAVAA